MVGFIVGAAMAVGGVPQSSVLISKAGGVTTLKFENGKTIHRTKASVTDVESINVPGSTVRLAMWMERNGKGTAKPFYAISLDGSQVNRVQETSYDIDLKYAKFDPLRSQPLVEPRLVAGEGNELYIVQFVTQPLDDYRETIESVGGVIKGFAPNNGYLVALEDEDLATVRNLGFVRAVVPFHPAYRAEQWALDRIASGNNAPVRYNFMLAGKGPEIHARMAALIDMVGGTLDNQIPESWFMTATLTAEQLVQVLHSNDVIFVDRWSAPQNDMDNVKVIGGQVGLNSSSTPLNRWNGQGVRGAVQDGGLRTSHLAFNGPNGGPILQMAVGVDSHGTATYGINFGDGDGNTLGTGMLPQARGIFASYQNYLNGGGNRLALTQQLLSPGFEACYQSNSWGDSQVTTYTNISAQMDDILYQCDITILQSQSNTGSQLSRPQAWAKNIVSVGAYYHFNNQLLSDDRWQSGASVGPAADGRLKPDLANVYDSTLTTTSSSDTAYTTSFGGTSGATPITAGHFGIFFQMWSEGVFGNSALNSTVFANRPKAALAKAFMVNTARQHDPAVNTDILRRVQGWGTANLTNLWNARTNVFFVNETQPLNNLQTATYKLRVNAGQPQLKVTMVYKDPAGLSPWNPARVNQLSLRVTSPTGSVYWGNVGMATTGMWSTPGGTENTVDTVENVFVQNPGAGTWTVEVLGSDINTDADPTTPGTNARFALVATGVEYSIAPSSFTVSPGSLLGGNLASLDLSDNDRVRLGEPNDGENVGDPRYIIAEAAAPVATLSSLGVVAEIGTGLPTTAATIDVWDWNTSGWVNFASAAAGTINADNAIRGTQTSNINRFVRSGDRMMRTRVRVLDTSLASESNFEGRIDQIRFEVQSN